MSSSNKSTPRQPEQQQTLNDLNPPAGVDVSGSDAPGRAELEQLAGVDGVTGQPGECGAPLKLVVVEEKHRVMATFVFGAMCDGLQAVMPISYRDQTRAQGAEALAPLAAKYEDVFPEWYVRWKEEIAFGMFMAGFIGGTVREVKRVQAIEADVKELSDKYVAQGKTRAEARKQALADLGYTESSGAGAAACAGA